MSGACLEVLGACHGHVMGVSEACWGVSGIRLGHVKGVPKTSGVR